MQVSLEAFSLQKSFCNISSYISYLVMNVWNMQMCQNIKVENKRFVRYIYFIVIIFQLMYFISNAFFLMLNISYLQFLSLKIWELIN